MQDLIGALLATMTPEQKASLVLQLVQPTAGPVTAPAVVAPDIPAPPSPTAVKKRGKLDMKDAVAISFKARLTKSPMARSQEWAERYDHIWFKGHYQVKGPKGGVYCLGHCVLGNPKREQVKGTLKISNRAYLSLAAGEPIDGWFIPDGTTDNILIGILSHLTPLP